MESRKPIFVILLHNRATQEALERIRIHINEKGMEKDYHVLVSLNNSPNTEFQMFSESAIDPIELEGLKALVLKSI